MWFWRDHDNSGARTKKRLKKQCQVHVTQMIHLECSFITIRSEGEGQTKYTSIQHQYVQFPAHLKHFLYTSNYKQATMVWLQGLEGIFLPPHSSAYCCVLLQTPLSSSIISQPKVAITRTGNHIITTGNIHMNRMAWWLEGMGDRYVFWALLEWINPWDFFLDPQYSISYLKKKNPFSVMKQVFHSWITFFIEKYAQFQI